MEGFTMNRLLRSVLVVCAGLGPPVSMAAEPSDLFSRANCFNNESITYNYFAPPQWRAVISWHYDTHNNNAVHLIAHAKPISCFGQYSSNCPTVCTPAMNCLYPLTQDTRHAGIHNVYDGVPIPGVTTRWRVHGYHNTTYTNFGFPIGIVTQTDAVDCNLHLEQFY